MRYRKRPVVVDAVRWTGDNLSEITAFVGRRPGTNEDAFQLPTADSEWDQARLWAVAEGCWMRCPTGHWVIKGIAGEFYPHEPTAFDRVYEQVEEAPQGTANPPAPRGPFLGASAVVLQGGRVLLGRRRGAHGAGTYAFPGGKVHPGEQPTDTVVRELREETGLVPTQVQPITWTNDLFAADGLHFITLHHLVEVPADAVPRLLEPDKCGGWDWYAWSDLPSPLFLAASHLVDTGWHPPVRSQPPPVGVGIDRGPRSHARDRSPSPQRSL